MEPDTVRLLLSVALGFGVAGLLGSAYQLATEKPASFRLLNTVPRSGALPAVAFLVFAAPFIITRNTVRGWRIENRRLVFVALALIIAVTWALMSGTVLASGLQAMGLLST
jgi:hypothetical protein